MQKAEARHAEGPKDSLPQARKTSHSLSNSLYMVLAFVFAPELAPSKATEH